MGGFQVLKAPYAKLYTMIKTQATFASSDSQAENEVPLYAASLYLSIFLSLLHTLLHFILVLQNLKKIYIFHNVVMINYFL